MAVKKRGVDIINGFVIEQETVCINRLLFESLEEIIREERPIIYDMLFIDFL